MGNGYADLAQRSGKVKALREQMLYANGYANLAADPNESAMSTIKCHPSISFQRTGKVDGLGEQMLYANGYADLAADPNESQMSPFNWVLFRRLKCLILMNRGAGGAQVRRRGVWQLERQGRPLQF